jgi:Fe-S-cluster containining protein
MDRHSGLSRICVDLCGGRCCEPWWGIIIYSMTKRDGLSRLSDFKREVVRGIASRAERITSRYITNETPPRLLFGMPDRYNVTVEKVEVANGSLRIELRAMFAFKCLFLSPGGECLIHPSKAGSDIRPPHCARLGSPDIKANEEGYCRIIDAAVRSKMDESEVADAIEAERVVSKRHYDNGCTTIDEAADGVIRQIRAYCAQNAPNLLPVEGVKKPGRNEPCPCGSGVKYKKCHGRV